MARRPDRRVGVGGLEGRDQHDPVAGEQPGRLVGREPAAEVLGGQEPGHERLGVVLPDPGQLWYLALVSRPPRAVPHGATERAGGALRIQVRRNRRFDRTGGALAWLTGPTRGVRRPMQQRNRFLLVQRDGYQRFGHLGLENGWGQVAECGRHGDRHDRVDALVLRHLLEARSERPLADRRGRIDRAGDRGAAGQQPAEPLLCRLGQGRHLEAIVPAGVGSQHAGTAGVGDDGDPVAAGQRPTREQGRGIDELAKARRSDDASLAEQRFLGDQRGGGGRRMRGGGALARRRPAADDGQHRELPADPAGSLGEPARAAERLDVQQGQFGLVVLFPPHQHVVARHVVLVPDGGEGRHSDPQPGQVIEHGDPDAAGLHDQPGAARNRLGAGEGGVQAERRDSNAETVRADQTHPVPAAGRQQPGTALGVDPCCYHH